MPMMAMGSFVVGVFVVLLMGVCSKFNVCFNGAISF
jgi:hypothetical protein